MDDEAPQSTTPSPKRDTTGQPTDAELSRIAREAVHQPPDARLDKQLVRLGLLDAPDGANAVPTAPTTPESETSARAALDPELERLRADLSRATTLVRLLVGIVAVLGVLVVALLVR